VKVELSARAEADLQVIARWIALDNPDAARAFRCSFGRNVRLSRAPRGGFR